MGCLMCGVVNCPPEVQGLAIIGGIVIYGCFALLFGTLFAQIFNKKLGDDGGAWVLLGFIFPATIVALILLGIFKIIYNLATCATKQDLNELEVRLNTKIETVCKKETKVEIKTAFQIGDLITGIKGNPDNYEHLNEGCIAKVISIDEKGRMEVILLDHKDFKNQKEFIGQKFKAPARNFKLFKKSK